MHINELYADRDKWEEERAIQRQMAIESRLNAWNQEYAELAVYQQVYQRLIKAVIVQSLTDLCSKNSDAKAKYRVEDARLYLTDPSTQSLIDEMGLRSRVNRMLDNPVKPKALRCSNRRMVAAA